MLLPSIVPPKNSMRRIFPGLIILKLLLGTELCLAVGQASPTVDQNPLRQLNAEQVVENLVRMNQERAHALLAYQATRVYRLEYKGFPGGRTAEMVVKVKYQAPATKEFEVISETGSKVLIDRVFRKLLQSEKEAFEAENQKRIAINQENYEFRMIGFEDGTGGPCYVLSVKPRTRNKYLFQGKIWVDAEQFAIVKIQGEPAKNPSFWIRDTKIETRYVNVDDFWLPEHNHSVTAVRLGGHADFNIEYKNYQVTGASPWSKLSRATETAR